MDINSSQKHILVIDDEDNMRHMLSIMLKKAGYQISEAPNGSVGIEMLEQSAYDFILCDIKMPVMDGMAFLKSAEGKIGKATVIMMSAYGSVDRAVKAIKLGAYDYISKPFNADEIIITLKKAEERELLKEENFRLKAQVEKIEENYRFGNMVAKSNSMKKIFMLAEKMAQNDTTVFISGESGTGKELIAKGIHFSGNRSKSPFVPVNCGGIPENLIESEFFGYKKGAFTGADKDKTGLFQEADNGTIFLDEIGELPVMLQVKLLRVLQEREIRKIGSSKTHKIDVRVIAATSRNLEEEVKTGTFREDLYYRIKVVSVDLPPLRERTEDIPLLTRLFVDRFNQKIGRDIHDISPDTMARLLKHNWPGNVRELENVMERAVVLAEKQILLPENLPESMGIKYGNRRIDDLFEGFSIKTAHKVIEKRLISRALDATGGNRTKAARLLEISHPSLLSKMKAYDINK